MSNYTEVERLRSGIGEPLRKLGRLIEYIEEECDTAGPVCHEHDLTDTGECALVSDLQSIRSGLLAAVLEDAR